jgi:predicted secreted protein
MNHSATLSTTGTPGVYQGRVKVESAGDWQAQVSYEGPVGKGKSSFTVTAQ